MTTEYVNRPDLRILTCLYNLAHHHGKTYCYPNVETIKQLLTDHYQLTLSTRTLWRHLGALARDRWIEITRRHRKAPDGSLELHSNLYKFRLRTHDYFDTAARGVQRMVRVFRASIKKHAVPQPAQYSPNEYNHKSTRPENAHAKRITALHSLRELLKRRK